MYLLLIFQLARKTTSKPVLVMVIARDVERIPTDLKTVHHKLANVNPALSDIQMKRMTLRNRAMTGMR